MANSLSQAFLGGIIGAVISGVVTFGVAYLTFTNDSRELDLKMIDVSLAILAGKKGETKDDQPKAARRFAIMALKQHSNVTMSDEHWESWVQSKTSIPIPPFNLHSRYGLNGHRGYIAPPLSILPDQGEAPPAKKR